MDGTVRLTDKFRNMCELYKIFAQPFDCDFSEKAMQEMFEYESFGIGNIDISGFNTIGIKPNGYAVGKKWLNVTVSMWKEDYQRGGICREFLMEELFTDPLFKDHHEWLIDILGLRYVVNEFKKELNELLTKTA